MLYILDLPEPRYRWQVGALNHIHVDVLTTTPEARYQ